MSWIFRPFSINLFQPQSKIYRNKDGEHLTPLLWTPRSKVGPIKLLFMPSDAFSQLEHIAGRTDMVFHWVLRNTFQKLLYCWKKPSSMCIPCAVKYRIESHHSFVALSRFSSIANIVPERWLTQEGVVGRQEREKPTDSQQEEKRTALTALAAEIGREGRLVLCLSRAKGTFPLQWSYTRVLGSSKGSLYLDIYTLNIQHSVLLPRNYKPNFDLQMQSACRQCFL